MMMAIITIAVSGTGRVHADPIPAQSADTVLSPQSPQSGAQFTSCDAIEAPSQAECEALVALYNSTNGAEWSVNTGWLTSNVVCEWSGVTCREGQVIRLELAERNLSGPLPAQIGNLIHLETLALFRNDLTGPLPAEIGQLTSLTELFLDFNRLNGALPAALGNLVNVRLVHLNNNEFSGPLPPEMGNMAALFNLLLYDNQLTGTIPATWGNLSELRRLLLPRNQLSGTLPAQLGNLSQLIILELHNNQLSGAVPASLGNLTVLSELYLDNNQFSGSLPASLTNLQLQQFNYHETELCAPDTSDFRTWLTTIPQTLGTGEFCESQATGEIRAYLPFAVR